MSVIASAPGKIVLSGEYAVLDGAAAICMAVDRRARVSLVPSSDGACHLSTPGFSGEAPSRIVDAVCGTGRPPFDIELDTREFAENDQKIGLGSSAALTTALVAALERSEDVFVKALLAHSEFQGGSGSGVDVAAAAHGGLIEYTMPARRVSGLAWPAGLHMRVLWTGVAASTTTKLEKLAAHAGGHSRPALIMAADMMAATWRSGDSQAVLSEYVSYIDVLRRFSVDHDLGIFDAGHDELTDAAMADGLIYKPAGAGGGDVGVLFGRTEDDVDAFVERRRGLIHGVIACALDPEGVRLEQS